MSLVTTESSVSWGTTPRSPLKGKRHFGGTCRFHLRGGRLNQIGKVRNPGDGGNVSLSGDLVALYPTGLKSLSFFFSSLSFVFFFYSYFLRTFFLSTFRFLYSFLVSPFTFVLSSYFCLLSYIH
jgi:hypothetical protein